MSIEFSAEKSIRINKYLSEAGVCSRRGADELIISGAVKIDGIIASLGSKVASGQIVTVNGTRVNTINDKIYIAYNKPAGITCTSDRSIPGNIIDAIDYPERLFTIGRLDKPSTGLIFLTNDGDIVNKILRSGNNHEKEYIVKLDKPYDEDFVISMSNGIPILGTVTRKCKVIPLDKYSFRIILTQGLNRQIRRMCEYLGYNVMRLHRVRIMNVHLATLKEGNWRYLTYKEVDEIKKRVFDSYSEPVPYEEISGSDFDNEE
jgi:23S rRNA pseudouridine2604 synthase